MISNIIPSGSSNFRRARHASDCLVAELLKTPISGFYRDALLNVSPSPFVIDTGTMLEMAIFHEAIIRGACAVVEQWPANTKLRKLIPLPPKIEELLLKMKKEPYTIGTIRPDVLFPKDGPFQICEINARFPLNGFLSTAAVNDSMHQETAKEDSIYAELGLSPLRGATSFLRDLKSRFLRHCRNNTIWLLHAKESEHDTAIIEAVLGIPVRRCRPDQLTCNGDSSGTLYCREDNGTLSEIQCCVLEMHQGEYLGIDDDALDALARLSCQGATLNDLRTIFLVHDKRMLGILRSDVYNIDSETRQVLRKHIIPTTPAFESSVSALKASSWVLKPCCLGKGEGILMQKNMSSDDFVRKVQAVASFGSHVLQPFLEQRKYELLRHDGTIEMLNSVGMLISLDGIFYGPGLFRSDSGDLISLEKRAVASYPSFQLKVSPPPARFFSPTLEEVNYFAVKKSIVDEGIALLAVKFPLQNEDTLLSFLSDRLEAKPRATSKGDRDVWEKRLLENSTLNDPPSYASLAFEIHKDPSFEKKPARFVAMSFVDAGKLGGGRLPMARISDVVRELDAETKSVLQTLCPRWILPDEVRKSGPEMGQGPASISEFHAGLHRDGMAIHGMSEEKAVKFRKAFEVFLGALQRGCAQNEMILPEQSVIILDKHRFVHSRSPVFDSGCVLHQIRFDLPHFD